MESKLKALKVVELKDILQRAGVAIPAKANKPDLIAKIIGSQAAIDLFNSNGTVAGESSRGATPAKTTAAKAPAASQKTTFTVKAPAAAASEDLLEPPEEFDWNGDGASNKTQNASTASSTSTAKTSGKSPNKSATSTVTNNVTALTGEAPAKVTSTAAVDEGEEEKRKARAERFGIPVVEPKNPVAKTQQAQPVVNAKAAQAVGATTEDKEKLASRAARFGIETKPAVATTPATATATADSNTGTNGRKRAAPTETIDTEELERRRKRAERFGIPLKT